MKDKLTTKFVVYLAIILIVVVGTTNYWLYRQTVAHLNDALNNTAAAHLEGVASLSSYYISHFENELLQELIVTTAQKEGINFIAIETIDGDFSFFQGSKEGANSQYYYRDVMDSEQLLGLIELSLDNTQLKQNLRQAAINSIALGLVTVLLIGGMLFIFFRSQIVAAVQRANEEKEFFTAVMNTTTSLVVVLDPAGRIVMANSTCIEAVPEELDFDIGAPVWTFFNIEYDDQSLRDMIKVEDEADYWHNIHGLLNGSAISKRKNGNKEEVIEWHFTKLPDGPRKIKYLIGNGMDITAQYHEQKELSHMAHHDALTGLPNRALFDDRLNNAVKRYKRTEEPFSLLYLDLDKFKPINDELGHEAGDFVLKEIAKRMLDNLREMDTVARLGGDEFAVLLPQVECISNAKLVSEKLIRAISTPINYRSHVLQLGASIGFTICPQDSSDAEQLLKYADTAMYQSKRAGRNTYHHYSHEMKLVVDNTSQQQA